MKTVNRESGIGNRTTTIALAVMLALAASGCATTGASVEPASVAIKAEGWRNAPDAAKESAWPDPQWWKGFGSAELVQLIESAEKNNHDLAAAGQQDPPLPGALEPASGIGLEFRQRNPDRLSHRRLPFRTCYQDHIGDVPLNSRQMVQEGSDEARHSP